MASEISIEQPSRFKLIDRDSNTAMLLQNFKKLKSAKTSGERRDIYEDIAQIYREIHQWKLSLKYYNKVIEMYANLDEHCGIARISSIISNINDIINE